MRRTQVLESWHTWFLSGHSKCVWWLSICRSEIDHRWKRAAERRWEIFPSTTRCWDFRKFLAVQDLLRYVYLCRIYQNLLATLGYFRNVTTICQVTSKFVKSLDHKIFCNHVTRTANCNMLWLLGLHLRDIAKWPTSSCPSKHPVHDMTDEISYGSDANIFDYNDPRILDPKYENSFKIFDYFEASKWLWTSWLLQPRHSHVLNYFFIFS